MLTSYMDVNFNKYSNVSFLKFVCTVFISSKNHIQVLNRSSKAGAALVKTITSDMKCLSDLDLYFKIPFFLSILICLQTKRNKTSTALVVQW